MNDHDTPEWLADVGWKVHDLVRRPEAMRRFRDIIERWRQDLELQKQLEKEWLEQRESHFRSHFSWSIEFAEHKRWFDESAGPPGEGSRFEAESYTLKKHKGVLWDSGPIWCWFPPELCLSQQPQVHSPVSFCRKWRDCALGVDHRRKLTLPERYALCAAIHDSFCDGVEKFVADENEPGDMASHLKWAYYTKLCAEVATQLQDCDERAVEAFLADVADDLAKALQNAKPSHSSDFTSVNWFGQRYEFAKGNQAESIRVLWEAFENGRHSLSQESIGEHIGFSGTRFELAKVFRSKKPDGGYGAHLAWGTMIQSDSKGTYRLTPPHCS